mgnify:FL=1
MKIILASHNIHKMEEMKVMLKNLSVDVITLDNFPEIGDIPETGKTLEENALLKARIVNEITGLPAIGDDTGLEVDALNGAPGVYSARYAGENVSYEENVNKLVKEMEIIKEEIRSARFRAEPTSVGGDGLVTTEATIEGIITKSSEGINGFGNDPVFYIPKTKCTFAELSTEEKNRISHRGLALQKLCKFLFAHWSTNKTIGE